MPPPSTRKKNTKRAKGSAMTMMEMILGGGATANVAIFFVLRSIKKDNRQTQRRVKRIERHIWPEVFGEDACED
jgi:hypothetical protein